MGVHDGKQVLRAARSELATETQLAKKPVLLADLQTSEEHHGVGVYGLDPGAMDAIKRHLQAGGMPQSILHITVAEAGSRSGDGLPAVSGLYVSSLDGLRFLPHFPFELGLAYRAIFDPRPLRHSALAKMLTLEFTMPAGKSSLPAKVTRIFPSGDSLPENILRFYVCFSNPMQRGKAETEISVLDSDGNPMSDVLYRAPVELWDRNMRSLTILLDPGRLKRGVGPNRELGPPLKPNHIYCIAVGAGMTDLAGNRLGKTVIKRFHVADSVRETVATKEWRMELPLAESCQPLTLFFPRPLDWAQLANKIVVASAAGYPIAGRAETTDCERRWRFTPACPWVAGFYHIRVESSLEDICGNNLISAFDRSLRRGDYPVHDRVHQFIPFLL